MASRHPKFHGRVEGARDRCAVPGCGEPGEFKAPLAAAQFRRARFLALPVPGACSRAQCEVQFLQRHEPRRDHRSAVAAGGMGPRHAGVRACRIRPGSVVERLRRSARRHLHPLSPFAAANHPRASIARSSARFPSSGSATKPTSRPCATAIRSSSGVTTRTAMAAIEATKVSSAKSSRRTSC